MATLFVGGRWVRAREGRTRDVLNPFDQVVLAKVDDASAEDAAAAVASARSVADSGDWPSWSSSRRARLLRRIADLLEARCADLARCEVMDTGATLAAATAEVADAVALFRHYAVVVESDPGRLLGTDDETVISRVVYEPVGVCALITPSVCPLRQAARKLAPALAAGNAVVLKPSRLTPMATIRLVEVVAEAGVPRGAVNLVLGEGPEVGAELVDSPDVDLVSFTGRADTGQVIAEAAAGTGKRLVLEPAGKIAGIVFSDADLPAAVSQMVAAACTPTGPLPPAGIRLIVEDSVHDDFTDLLAQQVDQLCLGSGLDPRTTCGPLVSEAQLAEVEDAVALGLHEGARLVAGGGRPGLPELRGGFCYRPAVFDDCDRWMRIVREDTGGPLLTIERFTSEREAAELGNDTGGDTGFGAAAAVWSGDRARAERVARRLRHRTVWINAAGQYAHRAEVGTTPVVGIGGGGVHPAGLAEYRETKHIYENTDPGSQGRRIG